MKERNSFKSVDHMKRFVAIIRQMYAENVDYEYASCYLSDNLSFFCHNSGRKMALKPVWKPNGALSLLPDNLSCYSMNAHRHSFL